MPEALKGGRGRGLGGISPAYPPHTAERGRGPGASPSPSPGKPERKTRSGQLITSRSGSAICVGVESRCEPVLWPEAASCPRSFHFWVEDEAVVIHKRRGKPQRAAEGKCGVYHSVLLWGKFSRISLPLKNVCYFSILVKVVWLRRKVFLLVCSHDVP